MVTPKIGGRKIGDFQERWQPKNIVIIRAENRLIAADT